MILAEQKQQLYKFIEAADEKVTSSLITIVQQLSEESPFFSEEDLEEFDRRSREHTLNPESGIPWEESLARIRSKLKK